jgi:hypothetical protein
MPNDPYLCVWQHLLVVVPVVGILSDIKAFKPVLNAEVDEIFDVPLEMFLKVSPFVFYHLNYRLVQDFPCRFF